MFHAAGGTAGESDYRTKLLLIVKADTRGGSVQRSLNVQFLATEGF
jgi:hypothetical protein